VRFHGSAGRRSNILVLDAPLALVVNEAAAAAGAPLAAEVRLLGVAARLLLANTASDAEEYGSNEEAGECTPGEAVCVSADTSLLASGAECVAAHDGPSATRC